MSNFAEQLIAARKAKAMTQQQLAAAVHISRSRVSRWETGDALPDLEMLMKLSQVLEVEFLPVKQDVPQAEPMPEEPQPAPEEQPELPTRRWRTWMLAAAAVVAMVTLAAVLLGRSAPAPVLEPLTAAWYQQQDMARKEQAFVTVTPAENPTTAIRSEAFPDDVGWFYSFALQETAGVDFTITKITNTTFNDRGQDDMVFEGDALAEIGYAVTLQKEMPMPVEWGGGFPLQNVSGVGLAVEGVDANGNVLTFRGYVELSPEIAE